MPRVSTEIAARDPIIIPSTGEIVERSDGVACARALSSLREFKGSIDAAVRELSEAIVQHAKVEGTKTVYFGDRLKATVGGGSETVYDAEKLEVALRRAGMPEARIREIVVEQVSYKVSAVEAKRAAAANPDYARIVKRCSQTIEKPASVRIGS